MAENILEILDRVYSNAICGGHLELFYSPPLERPPAKLRREAAAKQICRLCSVQIECLEYARAAAEEHGLWGGETESERAVFISNAG